MRAALKAGALAAAIAAALLLWQRYGVAVALGDGGWFCLTG